MNIQFAQVVTAHGNCWRAVHIVCGRDFTLELAERTLLIIDDESRCESCSIDEDGDVLADGGEFVTETWTDEDWRTLTEAIWWLPRSGPVEPLIVAMEQAKRKAAA